MRQSKAISQANRLAGLYHPRGLTSQAALVVGRPGAKSLILALVAVYLACFRDYGPHLVRGEVLVSPSSPPIERKHDRSSDNCSLSVEGRRRQWRRWSPGETDETIELTNCVVIEIILTGILAT